jgi:diguanylate cyclase
VSFFNKNNTDYSEQWRKKYLNLFDEQNKIEHLHQEREKLLRQFIVQLSIISEGHDKYLDPILLRVRNHIKDAQELSVLKTEMKQFVESIKNLPPRKEALNVGLLFDFLLRQNSDPNQQAALNLLKSVVEQDDSVIKQPSDLFIELLKILETPALLQAPVAVNATNAELVVPINFVSQQLLEYLTALAIPSVYEEKIKAIKDILLKPNQSMFPFEEVLDDLIELLIEIKEYLEAEHKDIDQFLIQVAVQLSELNAIVMQANSSFTDSVKNRSKLDQVVFNQIRELQIEAIKITSLDLLKEAVNNSFKMIATEIKAHHQKDKELQQHFKEQIDEMVNRMIALELEAENLKAELKVAHSQSMHDALTGLPNRNAFNQRLHDEIARHKRYGTPLTLAIWDIDYFKKINDTFGHKSGDKVLVLTANLLQENTRETDFIARFGGEEFVMILSNTNCPMAMQLAEKLRSLVDTTGFNANGKAVPVTISCGLTEFAEDDTEDSFFERADQALYTAKNQGRNRCYMQYKENNAVTEQ